MTEPYAEEDIEKLFNIMGQGLWYLQHLENAVSTFTALKILQRKKEKGTKVTEQLGERVLLKQKVQTLGPLISSAKREKTIPVALAQRFDKFLKERNWLIHNSVNTDYLALRSQNNKQELFKRIDAFAEEAIELKKEIYFLLEEWYTEEGYDIEYAYNLAEQTLRDAEQR